MLLAPADLRDIHLVFGSAQALVERRRAVYSAVLELADGPSAVEVTPDLLDSPAVRAHLGRVIVDPTSYRSGALVPLSRLTAGAAEFTSGDPQAFVACAPEARAVLDPAVRHIESELGRHRPEAAEIRLLLADDPAFDDAAQMVVEGLELAAKLCPELADDLLPHVALFAIMGDDGPEQLGSASVREYPGLVVVPRPGSAMEVAEALVHEGAHQKFFDLGITRSVFGGDFHAAPLFRASWAPTSSTGWPMEQCAAAFHAYTCLATFNRCIRDSAQADRLHDFSLLPEAEVRADELGEWVLANRHFFGPDGGVLLAALAGSRVPSGPPASTDVVLDDAATTVVRRCRDAKLVAQMGAQIELYWLKL